MFRALLHIARETLTPETSDIICGELQSPLLYACNTIEAQVPAANICPGMFDVFHAFRLCPIERARVVLIGQDPYPDAGAAIGVAFGTRKSSLPQSLRNIYKCLVHHALVDAAPTHGDLSAWAAQGVLLLNTSLTTCVGVSGRHARAWKPFCTAMMALLDARGCIFIALGLHAQSATAAIAANRVFKWGHPSPLCRANSTDNPQNFIYCNVFTRASAARSIDWRLPVVAPVDPYESQRRAYITPTTAAPTSTCDNTSIISTSLTPAPSSALLTPLTPISPTPTTRDCVGEPIPLDIGTGSPLWVFTDGACNKNGRAGCRATWAYMITDGITLTTSRGFVGSNDFGATYAASNNRGELFAIYHALKYISEVPDIAERKVSIVSDSKYAIGCVSVWIKAWEADPTRAKDKKNMDVVTAAARLLDTIGNTHVCFIHTHSHTSEPDDRESLAWFLWWYNDKVDNLCANLLR